jgi:colanic acid biosynthesis protein WcaH
MSTPKQEYLVVIKHTQLIALDLILINDKNEVLLGYRNNNPAKNTWFTFGSRLFKDESFEDGCERIAKNELGIHIALRDCVKHGVYKHDYLNNFDNEDFGTNYFVFAFIYHLKDVDCNAITGDDQHSTYKWFSVEGIIGGQYEGIVHEYVRNYFIANPPNRVF